ncbi:hypothetical protein IF2G_01768 [Cordyceps javanica]|nr:hypothetical protein IF2G_01768 [Cordyceps javanica]
MMSAGVMVQFDDGEEASVRTLVRGCCRGGGDRYQARERQKRRHTIPMGSDSQGLSVIL